MALSGCPWLWCFVCFPSHGSWGRNPLTTHLTHSWYWLLVSWAGLSVRQVHMPPTCSMGPWQLGAWVPEGAAVGNVPERPGVSHDETQDVQDIIPPPRAAQASYQVTSTLIQGKESQTLPLVWRATWAQKEGKHQRWPAPSMPTETSFLVCSQIRGSFSWLFYCLNFPPFDLFLWA